MFVQFSQGLGSGCFRLSDRHVEVSSRLGLTVSKHPALAFGETDVFFG
jgi:hypothetical protein